VINDLKKWSVIFAAICVVAVALRLPRLAERPMHTDEAVHAVKFGTLLEEGTYRYDPYEYHGPTLNYFTLIPAWISGIKTYPELTEQVLRFVPVVFGILLIPLLLLVRKNLGWPAITAASIFLAISPAMVYYSRYYIMEILLVVFLAGVIFTGWRYMRSKNGWWAFGLGISLGLLYATKETSIIFLGAMGFAAVVVLWLQQRSWAGIVRSVRNVSAFHLVLVILSALAVSSLFYSSFFSYPQGILDSFRTFQTYFDRAGSNGTHIHPWYYYFHILLFWKYAPGPFWSEAPVVILALVGIYPTFSKKSQLIPDKRFVQFITIFTVISGFIFSAIPYKTPWNLLGFYFGMIVLAGVGSVYLFSLCTDKKTWMIGAIAGVVVTGMLFWQTVITNFGYYADPRNPYVYGHTSTDIYEIVERVHQVTAASPSERDMYIEVIAPGDDYWPLPWYLRDYPNVGWWAEVDFDEPAAPVILAKPAVEQDIMTKLYTMPPPGQRKLYVPLFREYLELRPHVEMRGYVTNDLWELSERDNTLSQND